MSRQRWQLFCWSRLKAPNVSERVSFKPIEPFLSSGTSLHRVVVLLAASGSRIQLASLCSRACGVPCADLGALKVTLLCPAAFVLRRPFTHLQQSCSWPRRTLRHRPAFRSRPGVGGALCPPLVQTSVFMHFPADRAFTSIILSTVPCGQDPAAVRSVENWLRIVLLDHRSSELDHNLYIQLRTLVKNSTRTTTRFY